MRINHVSQPRKKAKAALNADELITGLKGKTPAQIKNYIQNNATDLVGVQKFLYTILLYIQSDMGD